MLSLDTQKEHELIHRINAALSVVLGKPTPYWWGDRKLWLGIVCWLGVWARWLGWGYDGNYTVKACFCLGLDLSIMHVLQYYGRFGFVLIYPTLILQCVLQIIIWWREIDVVKRGHFDAESVYQNIDSSFLQPIFLFMGQMSLLGFYTSSLITNFDPDHVSYVYWLVGYYGLQMSAFFNRGKDSHLGAVWPVSEWHDLCIHADMLQFSVAGFGGQIIRFKVSSTIMFLRGVMGFMVNNVCRELIAFTVPIMLMQMGDPLNFVANCVCVHYIVTLDDMTARRFVVEVDPEADVDDFDEWQQESRSLLNVEGDERDHLPDTPDTQLFLPSALRGALNV